MKRPKIAVLGAGNWGRNHVRTLAALADVELAAVCDLDASRREEVERGFPRPAKKARQRRNEAEDWLW